jgi:hypothetical protein
MPIIAASLGFAITPSKTIALRIAGAAAGGLAGMLAKSILSERMRAPVAEVEGDEEEGEVVVKVVQKTHLENIIDNINDDNNADGGGGSFQVDLAPMELALQAIQNRQDLSSMSLKKLEQVARKCDLETEELGDFFTEVFAEVILRGVMDDEADFTELIDILEFGESIGLSASEIGDGFGIAALALGDMGVVKDDRGFFHTKPYEDSIIAKSEGTPKDKRALRQESKLRQMSTLLRASKMFFLADKMVGETTGYYGKRLTVSLSFFDDDEFKGDEKSPYP